MPIAGTTAGWPTATGGTPTTGESTGCATRGTTGRATGSGSVWRGAWSRATCGSTAAAGAGRSGLATAGRWWDGLSCTSTRWTGWRRYGLAGVAGGRGWRFLVWRCFSNRSCRRISLSGWQVRGCFDHHRLCGRRFDHHGFDNGQLGNWRSDYLRCGRHHLGGRSRRLWGCGSCRCGSSKSSRRRRNWNRAGTSGGGLLGQGPVRGHCSGGRLAGDLGGGGGGD